MHKLRQIIRLYCQGTGIKTIHGMIGISRNTIKKYVRIWHESGLSYEVFSKKSDAELSALFSTTPSKQPDTGRRRALESMLPALSKKLGKKGMTREMLHKEYLSKYPDGYSRSLFNSALRVYIALARPVMHLDHKAGDKMYIDFAGSKLQVTDIEGTVRDVEVFVAILGCSQLTYVEAVESLKKEDLIKLQRTRFITSEAFPRLLCRTTFVPPLPRGVNTKRYSTRSSPLLPNTMRSRLSRPEFISREINRLWRVRSNLSTPASIPGSRVAPSAVRSP